MYLNSKSRLRRAAAPALMTMAALGSGQAAQAAPPLDAGFRNPPASARTQTWWHWLNGNVTRAGITSDLEAMKRVGLGGAQIFNVDQGIPAGPVRFMSPEWVDMMKFASSEAKRLGLELTMHNCAGWSSSGGPWVTPEHAMQAITTSETRVTGGSHADLKLAQPMTRLGFYRDIAVLAFPTPPADTASMKAASPTVTTSVTGLDAAPIIDGNPGTYVSIPAATVGGENWVQFTFPQAYTARNLRLKTGPGRSEGRAEIQVSDDNTTFRTVSTVGISRDNAGGDGVRYSFPATTARYWRIAVGQKSNLAEADLSAELRIDNIAGKAAFVRSDKPQSAMPGAAAPDAVVNGVIDITSKMQPDGHLVWDAPAGDWTVIRFGYTPTGATNEPAAPEATGPESDKLSREATDAHWNSAIAPVLNAIGSRDGRSLNDVLIDSYEVGSENWSPKFREDFQRLRGYDPVPWLPVTTGRVVQSPEASERFLYDLRRTVCDLFTANYAGRFAELAHENGMIFSDEPYGNGTFADFEYGGKADIVMGEFWVGDSGSESTKLAASVAHVYGTKIVGAESFTSVPEHGRWATSPYSLKAIGDIIYTTGINRFIVHRYAMQPWPDSMPGRAPGMTMGPWGTHFERTETWWNQSKAWLDYTARCQYLLQEGLFAADVATFTGDDTPVSLQHPQGLPDGYDFDGLGSEVLQTRLAVKNGRLVLPNGMSYRVLTLPDSDAMTPETARAIAKLVKDGAIVLGPRPTHSPSLQNFPAADNEVRQIGLDVWGDTTGKASGEHACGKGRVIWGKSVADVLNELKITPDFRAFEGGDPKASTLPAAPQIHYIHRKIGDADVYFVASAANRDRTVLCSFRVKGRQPEIWNPETGETKLAAAWGQNGDATLVPVHFTPSGSAFVVFRSRAAGTRLISAQTPHRTAERPKVSPITIEHAEYGVLQTASDKVDVTKQLQDRIAQGQRKITASNDIAGDPASMQIKQMYIQYDVNGTQMVKTLDEGESFDLPEGATLVRAVYGLNPEQVSSPDQIMDVTAQVREQLRGGELHTTSGNTLAGRDPAFGTPKQLSLTYRQAGQLKTVTIGENQQIDLPAETASRSIPAEYEVSLGDDRNVTLLARVPGAYTFKDAKGREYKAQVPALPSIAVGGPWDVTFPPNLGAPAQATFPKLISWPDSTDEGIKYFSGTATYHTKFNADAAAIAPDRRYELDLGSVQVIAEPTLNGKPLGILWKPPFVVDVTGALKPGENDLEVKVTNLWPNRLIGDEQYPDDVKYTNNGNLAEWPDWILNNTPRPEPRRVTFTTWKHWHKGDALLPSGLIGPVTVNTADEVKLTPSD